MSNDDQKAGDPKKQQNGAASRVLDFLDKEIAASARSQDDQNAPQDDVDALVDSLLKQTITASDEEAIPHDAGGEDLNSLFSAIFRSEEDISETKPKDAAPAMDPRLSKTLKEVGVVDRESVNLRPVEKVPRREVESALSPEAPVSMEAVRSPGASPSARETHKEHPRLDQAVGSARITARTDQTTVLAPSSRAPRRRGLVLALSAALVCLLAGVGVVYFTGTKGNPLNKPNGLPQASTQTTPAKAETAEQSLNKPSPEARAGVASAGAAHPAQRANAPAASEVSKNTKNPESSKQTRPAISEPPVPTSPPNTGAGGNAQVDTAEKTTAPAAEKPAANPPSRTTENAAPPPPVQTQASSIQTLPNPVSPALAGLERLAAPEKSAAQPAPSPRNVTPAAAISRVAPVYPDIARKTHTTGRVVVEVTIDEQGKVVKATAQSGPLMLRDEAVKAAMKWQFKPASVGGTNVPSTTQITIVFTNPQL
jgi:protein TonB